MRSQLLSRLTAPDSASLEALNKRLWAWVEGEYHHTPHRGLDDQTPLDRWAMNADKVRLPGRSSIWMRCFSSKRSAACNAIAR